MQKETARRVTFLNSIIFSLASIVCRYCTAQFCEGKILKEDNSRRRKKGRRSAMGLASEAALGRVGAGGALQMRKSAATVATCGIVPSQQLGNVGDGWNAS